MFNLNKNVNHISVVQLAPRVLAADDKVPILMNGNGVAGFFLFFFTIAMVYFMIQFTLKIFVSQQLVREPLYVGKIDG